MGKLFGKAKPAGHFACPHCGAQVRRGAAACPECGSDEKTGWAEGAGNGETDIPTGYGGDDAFDYDEFVRREFPAAGQAYLRRWRAWAWWLLCLALALLFIRVYVWR